MDDLDITGFSSITVALWIKPSVVSSSTPGHGGAGESGDNEVIWLSHDGDAFTLNLGNDEMYGYVDPGANGGSGTSSYCSIKTTDSPISTDTWQFITGRWNGDKLTIYHNGNQVGSCDSGSEPFSSSAEHQISNHRNSQFSDWYDGKIEDVRIYNNSLTEEEIRDLYLNGRPFNGNYTSENIENLEKTKWSKVQVDTSSIPTDTDVDAVFKAKDSSDNVVEEQIIDLQEGKKNYSLDVSDSEKAEVVFNGSSSDVTKSWEIKRFKVFTGFCDYRGSKNECIMNTTRQLELQTYDVDSIFESRSKAAFEAFSGTSILNISNSSRLSGTWKGSFEILSRQVKVKPGARFTPENGRIIIGK